MNKNPDKPAESTNFSLVTGGPLYQLLQRAHLVEPPLKHVQRRIFAAIAITWLPLLLLALAGGTAFSGVQIPFIFDVEAHTRFLVCLTLLIIAEPIAHYLIQFIVDQFEERDIIHTEDLPKFNEIKAAALRLRNSITIEVSLLIFAFTVGHWIWTRYTTIDLTTWYAASLYSYTDLTAAGYWYAFISLPLFQFIALRWYFRLCIWYRFLWQVSKLPLCLNALHPDKAGGLGFLADSGIALSPALIAHTALLAGVITNRIWFTDVTLMKFKLDIIGIIVYLIFLAFIPLLFFILHLARTKRFGSRDYGNMASHYVNNFRRKWLESNLKTSETMLGTSDIQSLADLSNSFSVEQAMGITPFSKGSVIKLAILVSLPIIPLLLTIIPLESMISNALKLII